MPYAHGSCCDCFYFISPRGLSKQYYGEFIVPNEEVDKHLEDIGYSSEVLIMIACTFLYIQITIAHI